ncbi:MAG: acetyltransferase [Frankiales bacterium]|nr:acetyltransferase [Frankiales bacterium]
MAEVRPAGPADVRGIAAVYAPWVRDTVVSFEDVPPSADEMAARVGAALRCLVAVDGREVLGYACATPHRARAAYRWSVDVAVYLAPQARRRGLGRALYERLLTDLRDDGLVTAYAGITLPNAASVGLHEAMGFTQVARFPHVGFKHGAWHDVGWWARPLVDRLPVPPSGG